jgi:creatinine amidohydrolase/Fe(II)-dependent formamide hydrolase-like protein
MRMELSFPAELDKARKLNYPLFIPIGVMEYHSSHLAIGTDTIIVYEFIKLIEKQLDIVIAPPVWYGPASYAVRGPEGYSIDMDNKTFEQMMFSIFLSFLRSKWRNIYSVIFHQTEAFNPTETACLNASRRALFKYLEETRGVGWWGKAENEGFELTLSKKDNPWNWIKVMPLMPRNNEFKGDHAGKYETSYMWALLPEGVNPERIGTSEDWFAKSAVESDPKLGKDIFKRLLDYWLEVLKEG